MKSIKQNSKTKQTGTSKDKYTGARSLAPCRL